MVLWGIVCYTMIAGLGMYCENKWYKSWGGGELTFHIVLLLLCFFYFFFYFFLGVYHNMSGTV